MLLLTNMYIIIIDTKRQNKKEFVIKFAFTEVSLEEKSVYREGNFTFLWKGCVILCSKPLAATISQCTGGRAFPALRNYKPFSVVSYLNPHDS